MSIEVLSYKPLNSFVRFISNWRGIILSRVRSHRSQGFYLSLCVFLSLFPSRQLFQRFAFVPGWCCLGSGTGSISISISVPGPSPGPVACSFDGIEKTGSQSGVQSRGSRGVFGLPFVVFSLGSSRGSCSRATGCRPASFPGRRVHLSSGW